MKLTISACLWFFGILFSFAKDIASLLHWTKTGLVFGGIAVIIFAVLVWFHFREYKRAAKD